MNSLPQNNGLLPSGFEDLLPPRAEGEYSAITGLMAVFGAFGYSRVKPPMAEFEESLLAPGPGAAMVSEAFRLMDPESRKMMALRADITAQIARISLSRLSEEARPLRVSYANDVIRTRGSQARTQRQFCQIGCELVGVDSAAADIEIAVVALKGLCDLGVAEITLDFACPRVAEVLAEEADNVDTLRHELAGDVDQALAKVEALELSDEMRAHVARLKEVVSGVQAAIAQLGLAGVNLTYDPLETRGFEYHSGVAFTLFAKGARGELGRGGRYVIYGAQEQRESACGFTLYGDVLRQALPDLPEKEVKSVSADTSWDEIQKMQGAGTVVLRDV